MVAYPSQISRVRTTGPAGYTLINGTGTILSWTVPNDGKLHACMLMGEQVTTSAETGGQVQVSFTAPDGSTQTFTIFSGGSGAGWISCGGSSWQNFSVAPGGTITLAQSTALTAGAAKLWAEIWAA